jgi:hypothetical protein
MQGSYRCILNGETSNVSLLAENFYGQNTQFFLVTLLYMNPVTFNCRPFSVHELWQITCTVHMTVPVACIVFHPHKFVLISLPMNMCRTEVRDQCHYISCFFFFLSFFLPEMWSSVWSGISGAECGRCKN